MTIIKKNTLYCLFILEVDVEKNNRRKIKNKMGDDKEQPICHLSSSSSSSQFEDVFLNLLRGLEVPNLVILND